MASASDPKCGNFDDTLEFHPGYQQDHRWFPWLRWCPTSSEQLAQAESNILKHIKPTYTTSFITIEKDCHIRTIDVGAQEKVEGSPKVPVVMVHGLCGGIGVLVKSYNPLSSSRRMLAFDLLGFGRSSRVQLSDDAGEVEEQYVMSIERWRENMGLDSFVLVGHSLGAYLSCAYTLRHPTRVKHLVLVDAWGFGVKPDDEDVVWTRQGENIYSNQVSWWARGLIGLLGKLNPLAPVRITGPLGPWMMHQIRSDIDKKYEMDIGDGLMSEYLYHANAQNPTGENAFCALQGSVAWAKNPMFKRIGNLDQQVPITMIYGSRSWMDSTQGQAVKESRPYSYVDVQLIKGGSHHVYADCPEEFNESIEKICQMVDEDTETRQ